MATPATGDANSPVLHIEKAVYGGDGLARESEGQVVLLPFVLPHERVQRVASAQGLDQVRVLSASPDRVAPRCVHFGTCGGCQYQMGTYPAQLGIKQAILEETLTRAGLQAFPGVQTWPSPEPWGYRNRIRLRMREVEGTLRLGYNVRGSDTFLPICMCPIAAPLLWRCAEHLLEAANNQRDALAWLSAAAEVELFCDAEEQKVQIHLLCPASVPSAKGSFQRFAEALQSLCEGEVSLAVSQLHAASGRPTKLLTTWGPEGLAYRVDEDIFWLKPGSFFQVNRPLVPQMVRLVLGARRGTLAWDLYAGAGLFSRALARSFEHVTAVEASPVAFAELRRGLRAKQDTALNEVVLNFLRKAPIQRDRPELVVLDPPRAGAGEEACRLLLQLQPAEIVYVSCDPTTLARDAAVLTEGGYRVAELHMIDLFPQTYHLETVMVFARGNDETQSS